LGRTLFRRSKGALHSYAKGGACQTQRTAQIYENNSAGMWSSTEEASGTVTMSGSNVSTTPQITHAGLAINAIAAAAAKKPRRGLIFQ